MLIIIARSSGRPYEMYWMWLECAVVVKGCGLFWYVRRVRARVRVHCVTLIVLSSIYYISGFGGTFLRSLCPYNGALGMVVVIMVIIEGIEFCDPRPNSRSWRLYRSGPLRGFPCFGLEPP